MQPNAEKVREKDTRAYEPEGKELLIHFYFTEQVPVWFKLFSLFAVAWFTLVYVQSRYFGLFQDVAGMSSSERAFLAFYTAVPLILVGYIGVVFYWWFAHVLQNFSEWGRERLWARIFWFLNLILGSLIVIDPFDVILKNLAKVQVVSVPGIGYVNPLEWLLYGLLAYLIGLLCWNYIKLAWRITWRNLKEWWEYAVSLPMGLKITAIHLSRKNFTFYYPEQKREIPDYFRGRHILDFDENGEHLCISCKACERICPDRLILISFVKNPETKKLELTGFLLDNARCSFCGLCEDVCPTGAVRHTEEFEYSVEDRGDLILDLLAEYKEKSKELRLKRAREREALGTGRITQSDPEDSTKAQA